MESKNFCLGEHFTSFDDLKEKMRKYEEENFLNFWIRDSRKTEFYEIRYACKKWKYWSEVIVVSRFSSGFVTVYDQKRF